jgi:hypothetical protein
LLNENRDRKMTPSNRLPASILGGDPFNMFRFLYRRELLWKLYDKEYCISVMRTFYEAGGRAYDLSFDINTQMFSSLQNEIDEKLIGFGNPTWEQGVILNGRFIQYNRDRIIRTLVERILPRALAKKIKDELSTKDVLVFGYDRGSKPLTDEEIASIYLDEKLFEQRLKIFKDCKFILFGGSDADWLVSLGRIDIISQMADFLRNTGFSPYLLCQYASYVLPNVQSISEKIDGYAIPLNRDWSWFSLDDTVKAVKSITKPIIAFMPFASGGLRNDIQGALEWLYGEICVESILFGTATPDHAANTAILANLVRSNMETK